MKLLLICFILFALSGRTRSESGCDEGFYGPLCAFSCGHCAENGTCDGETGQCMAGCEAGWKVPLCNMPCTDNMFGQNCSSKCGNCYKGKQCDPFTGDCPMYDNTALVLIIRAFIIAGSVAGGIYIIVMIFCTVVCVRSRRRKQREMYLDDSPAFEDGNVPPVHMRRGTGRDGIFMTHLNSLMNLGQTPKGRKPVTEEVTFRRVTGENFHYATSGPALRDSEFSVVSDNNYVNMKSSVGPPRTSGGLIYANGILIDQDSAPPRGSYGDILNQYVNLKKGPNFENDSQDAPPSYSDAIYENSATTSTCI